MEINIDNGLWDITRVLDLRAVEIHGLIAEHNDMRRFTKSIQSLSELKTQTTPNLATSPHVQLSYTIPTINDLGIHLVIFPQSCTIFINSDNLSEPIHFIDNTIIEKFDEAIETATTLIKIVHHHAQVNNYYSKIGFHTSPEQLAKQLELMTTMVEGLWNQ